MWERTILWFLLLQFRGLSVSILQFWSHRTNWKTLEALLDRWRRNSFEGKHTLVVIFIRGAEILHHLVSRGLLRWLHVYNFVLLNLYSYILILLIQEAMEKFNPRDNMPIPWVQILEYGRDVFNRARLPSDLRVKWRNMMKKAGSWHWQARA